MKHKTILTFYRFQQGARKVRILETNAPAVAARIMRRDGGKLEEPITTKRSSVSSLRNNQPRRDAWTTSTSRTNTRT